jgi:predicted small metal-binding protein
VRVIRCDCGFEASGDGDDELVSRAQTHARDVHGMEVPADLVLGVARMKSPDRDG